MHPSSQTSTVAAKVTLLLLIVFLASIYLIQGRLRPSIAQSTEREFVDELPKHLPIKVKIKKEKEQAVKDLNNEKWVRDFQLEITNTGTKPIYYLSVLLILPGIKASTGHEVGFAMHYGRGELASFETKAGPDDIPIKPGETYVLSFPENKQMNWENFREREKQPDAKKLILHFEILSFGDGTGFVGTNGLALPRSPDVKSSLDRCEPSIRGSGGIKGQHAARRRWPTMFAIEELPAAPLLAVLLSMKLTEQSSILGIDRRTFYRMAERFSIKLEGQ